MVLSARYAMRQARDDNIVHANTGLLPLMACLTLYGGVVFQQEGALEGKA